MLALACFITFSASAQADNEKPINVTELPATAQQVISKNFANHKVASATLL